MLQTARVLSRAGYDVYAADSTCANLCLFSNKVHKFFKLPPAKSPSYQAALIRIIKEEKIDFLVPACEEIFYISGFLSTLQTYCEVLCDTREKLLLLHDKWSFYQYLSQHNIKTPDTYLASQLPVRLEHKRVIKPRFSRFASQVAYSRRIAPKKHSDSYIVQPFVKGQALCSYALVKNGQILAHTVYTTLLNAGKGAGILLQQTENKEIERIVSFIAQNLHFTGQLAFDFIKAPDGLYAIECNPRMTSGLAFMPQNLLPLLAPGNKEVLFPDTQSVSLALAVFIYFPLQPFKTFYYLKELCQAKEMIWDRADIKPFFMQTAVSAYWLWKGLFHGGPTRASTLDIEFNEDCL